MDESSWQSAYKSPKGATDSSLTPQIIIRRAILVGSAQALVWIGVGAAMLSLGTRCEKILRDFKDPLPTMSRIVINLNHLLYDTWYMFLPLVLICPLLNYMIASKTKFESGSTLRCVWYVLTWLAPALVMISFLLAYLMPLVAVISGLQAN